MLGVDFNPARLLAFDRIGKRLIETMRCQFVADGPGDGNPAMEQTRPCYGCRTSSWVSVPELTRRVHIKLNGRVPLRRHEAKID